MESDIDPLQSMSIESRRWVGAALVFFFKIASNVSTYYVVHITEMISLTVEAIFIGKSADHQRRSCGLLIGFL